MFIKIVTKHILRNLLWSPYRKSWCQINAKKCETPKDFKLQNFLWTIEEELVFDFLLKPRENVLTFVLKDYLIFFFYETCLSPCTCKFMSSILKWVTHNTWHTLYMPFLQFHWMYWQTIMFVEFCAFCTH